MDAIPPPPMPVRRVLRVVWPLGMVAVTALAAPVLVVGCLMALVDRRARLLRMTGLVVLLGWADVRMLLGCWRLWLASPRQDSPTWREDHERLLAATLDEVMAIARKWGGFRVELAEPMGLGRPDTPLIALARHAGPADSLALAWLLMHTAQRTPRVVLANALRWDPSVDLMLTRLQSYFVPSKGGAGGDRVQGVADLAASLEANDVLLIFPEGQNWSPRRRAGLIQRFRHTGRRALARRAAELWNVLPPRSAGAGAAAGARPDADVMVIAHAGFERLTGPREIWDAFPFDDRPFLVRAWTHDAPDVPRAPEPFGRWLDERWTTIDEWVEEHSPDERTREPGP
jgi:1-acyl-sn-glycerol-3-phosphate acyltransferase